MSRLHCFPPCAGACAAGWRSAGLGVVRTHVFLEHERRRQAGRGDRARRPGLRHRLDLELGHGHQPRHARDPIEEAAEVVIRALEAERDRPLRGTASGDNRLRRERLRCRAPTRWPGRAGCGARPADPFHQAAPRSSAGARPRRRRLRAAAAAACPRSPARARRRPESTRASRARDESSACAGPISICQAPTIVSPASRKKTIVWAREESSWKLLAMTMLLTQSRNWWPSSAPAHPAVPAWPARLVWQRRGRRLTP